MLTLVYSNDYNHFRLEFKEGVTETEKKIAIDYWAAATIKGKEKYSTNCKYKYKAKDVKAKYDAMKSKSKSFPSFLNECCRAYDKHKVCLDCHNEIPFRNRSKLCFLSCKKRCMDCHIAYKNNIYRKQQKKRYKENQKALAWKAKKEKEKEENQSLYDERMIFFTSFIENTMYDVTGECCSIYLSRRLMSFLEEVFEAGRMNLVLRGIELATVLSATQKKGESAQNIVNLIPWKLNTGIRQAIIENAPPTDEMIYWLKRYPI